MEIKKGKIKEIGQLEQTKNGAHLLHMSIQIGVDKTFNRYTGAEEESPEMVDYTLWHDEARAATQVYGVNDVVEIELSHYVDRQWHRTNVITRNIKLLKKADGSPANAAERAMAAQAKRDADRAAQAPAPKAPQPHGDDLPF